MAINIVKLGQGTRLETKIEKVNKEIATLHYLPSDWLVKRQKCDIVFTACFIKCT